MKHGWQLGVIAIIIGALLWYCWGTTTNSSESDKIVAVESTYGPVDIVRLYDVNSELPASEYTHRKTMARIGKIMIVMGVIFVAYCWFAGNRNRKVSAQMAGGSAADCNLCENYIKNENAFKYRYKRVKDIPDLNKLTTACNDCGDFYDRTAVVAPSKANFAKNRANAVRNAAGRIRKHAAGIASTQIKKSANVMSATADPHTKTSLERNILDLFPSVPKHTPK